MSRTEVEVAGRRLTVSNLDKVLYPATGTTKARVLRHYVDVAEVMLPHLAGRPVTMKRFPDGVDGEGFFEKRRPSHAPDWIGRIDHGGPRPEDRVITHARLDEPAALAWAANLAALELHVPMGRAPDPARPTAVVFDLDPGAPADVRNCAEVACRIREVLDQLGLAAFPTTSGSKGLQLYVPVHGSGASDEDTRTFALAVARTLTVRHPDLVVAKQDRSMRAGKVLIDWSQNHRSKTTICPYSVRARAEPTVATPVTWEEVEAAVGAAAGVLRFDVDDVRGRIAAHGDLLAPVAELSQTLPSLATG